MKEKFEHCRYKGNDRILFDLEGKTYEVTPRDALNIVYTVYDCLGLPLTQAENLEDILYRMEDDNFRHTPIVDDNFNFIDFKPND